jgi:hypothetical protein
MTTNKINGKKYIGIDSKNDPNYIGSGKFLKLAVKKYGKENFYKEILEKCEDQNSLLEREKYWISYYKAVEDKNYYNIHEGGKGGDIRIFMSEEDIDIWKNNISEGKKGLRKGMPLSESNKEGISKGLKNYYSNGGVHPNKGKSRTEETKIKISNSLTGREFTDEHKDNLKKAFKSRDYNGENNPFYGNSSMSGKNNPMYGKSFYDVWVEKYGKDEADIKMEEWINKRRNRKNKIT